MLEVMCAYRGAPLAPSITAPIPALKTALEPHSRPKTTAPHKCPSDPALPSLASKGGHVSGPYPHRLRGHRGFIRLRVVVLAAFLYPCL